MNHQEFSKSLNGYSTTRRTLLKTAAMATAGAAVPCDASASKVKPALMSTPSQQVGRREHAMSTGGLSIGRLDRMHNVMAGYVERGEVPGIVTLVS